MQEGFDCVLRIGELAASDQLVRRLDLLKICNVVSPAYLENYGTPTTLDDYAAKLGTQDATCEYVDDDVVRELPMRHSIVVNSADTYQAACIAGLGLIQVPLHGTQRLIDSGQLVAVMPAFTAAPMPMSFLYPNRRQLTPRVVAMLE